MTYLDEDEEKLVETITSSFNCYLASTVGSLSFYNHNPVGVVVYV